MAACFTGSRLLPGLAPASAAKHPRRIDAGWRLILGEGDRAIWRRPRWISATPSSAVRSRGAPATKQRKRSSAGCRRGAIGFRAKQSRGLCSSRYLSLAVECDHPVVRGTIVFVELRSPTVYGPGLLRLAECKSGGRSRDRLHAAVMCGGQLAGSSPRPGSAHAWLTPDTC